MKRGQYIRLARQIQRERLRRQSTAAAQITVVAGRPGSGKSTYVREHFQPGELLIDFDALGQALSGQPPHYRDRTLIPFIKAAELAAIRRLERPHSVERAWVLTSRPDAEERRQMVKRLNAQLVELDVPADECCTRIAADPDRPPLTDDLREYIEMWEASE